mgnify:CR=1 FL=1
MCKFFIIGIRVQFENSVFESVVVSKQEYQRVRFDTTTFYMLIIIRLSHLLPALAFLDFADRQSAYPSPCLCFSLFVQHRASGLLPLFLHCRKCRAWRIRFAEFPISDYWRLVFPYHSVLFSDDGRSMFSFFPDGWFPVQRYMRKMRFGEIVRD